MMAIAASPAVRWLGPNGFDQLIEAKVAAPRASTAMKIARTEVAALDATSTTFPKVHRVASDGRTAYRSTYRMTSPATCSAIEKIPIDHAIRRTVEAFKGAT